MTVGTNDLPNKDIGLGHPDHISAECAKADGPEFRVTQRDGMLGSPLLVGKPPPAEIIDLGLEWAVEPMLPALQGGQDRKILGAERMQAGLENIGNLSLIDKDGGLTLTDGQPGPHLDFIVVSFKPVDHRVVRVVGPLDDINKFTADFIEQAHLSAPVCLTSNPDP